MRRSPRALPASPARVLAAALLVAVPASAADSGAPPVDCRGGTLSVDARRIEIGELVETIGRRCGLEIEWRGPREAPVTLTLERLSLAEALDRILAPRGYVLRTAPPGKLWVYAPESRVGDGAPATVAVRAPDREPPAPAPRILPAALRWALADPDRAVRLAAVGELAALPEPATAALAAVAGGDAEVAVREEAVYALGEVAWDAGSAGLDALGRSLLDPEPRVREAAVDALADLAWDAGSAGSAAATWALAGALEVADPGLRVRAVRALGEIEGELAAGLLERALGDESDAVREAAAEALDERAGGS